MVLRKDFSLLADTHTESHRLRARLWQSQASFPTTASSCGALAEEGGVPGSPAASPPVADRRLCTRFPLPPLHPLRLSSRWAAAERICFGVPLPKSTPASLAPQKAVPDPHTHSIHLLHPLGSPARVLTDVARRRQKSKHLAPQGLSASLYQTEPLLRYTLQSGCHMGSHGDPQPLLSPEEAGVKEEAVRKERQCPWGLG